MSVMEVPITAYVYIAAAANQDKHSVRIEKERRPVE